MKILLFIACLTIAVAGCTTTKVEENPPGSGNFSTNHVVDPRVTSTIETIGVVNEATKAVNPFSPLVEIGLGAAAAIAAWLAKRKNDQAAQSALLLKTVVQGVEQANNSTVKQVIKTHAVNLGVEGPLGTAVAKINSGT